MVQKEKQKVTLDQLPVIALYKVLTKVSNRELCRLGRTCSYVYNFVEEHRKKLASRPSFGMELQLKENENGIFLRHPQRRLDFFSIDQEFSKKISAVSISSLHLDCKIDDDETLKKVKNALESIGTLKKTRIEGTAIRSEYLKELAETLDCQEEIFIERSGPKVDQFLEIMRQAKNREKFRFRCNTIGEYLVPGFFNLVKEFTVFEEAKYFGEGSTAEGIQSLLREIHEETNLGNVKTIICVLKEASTLSFKKGSVPPMITLWSQSKIPKDKRPTGRTNIPKNIRLMVSFSKFIVISDLKEGGLQKVKIEFIHHNLVEVWMKTMELLEIEETVEEEFLTANDTRKAELVTEAYLKDWEETYGSGDSE